MTPEERRSGFIPDVSRLQAITRAVLDTVSDTADATPGLYTNRTQKDSARFHSQVFAALTEKGLPVHCDKEMDTSAAFRVDCYIPSEETVIEIALSLHNSANEFERDIFKALLLKSAGYPVSTLLLIGGVQPETRSFATKRVAEPLPWSIREYVRMHHGLTVWTVDLIPKWLRL